MEAGQPPGVEIVVAAVLRAVGEEGAVRSDAGRDQWPVAAGACIS